MKTKRTLTAFGVAILLLPILFAVVMHREVAGAVTIFTIRGTNLRIYQSDSGNLALAQRSDCERLLKELEWAVTRRNRIAWWMVNAGILYIEFPFLVTDVLHSRD